LRGWASEENTAGKGEGGGGRRITDEGGTGGRGKKRDQKKGQKLCSRGTRGPRGKGGVNTHGAVEPGGLEQIESGEPGHWSFVGTTTGGVGRKPRRKGKVVGS